MSTDLEYLGKKPDPDFHVNQKQIDRNVEVPENKNAFTVGPYTIQDGATVTVPDNSVLVIL